MCYKIAHDKQQPRYEDKKNSIGDIPIPKNETTEALEALYVTFNFIDLWLKLFHQNYEVRWKMYNEAMKKLFKQIPTMKSKPLSHDKKDHKILIEIGGGWYMKKVTKGLPPLRKQKLSKRALDKDNTIKRKTTQF